jgi:hypothetical protein
MFQDRLRCRVAQLLLANFQAKSDAEEGRGESRILERVPDVKVDALFGRNRRRCCRFADLGNSSCPDRFQTERRNWIRQMGHCMALA